ncbi:hypothetical protein [Stenotrophomonas indicatrix]|uniref:hypothetical protein n=1 Tax=Stenotrophomonas indicatrix TaxID=2045451 RepID=UPI0028A5BA58|nr:hypothetical protein [Stenotrophomonas indicatrix]
MSDEFEYSKLEVADAHFDAACRAFLTKEHSAVIVTLSGVAEEIYGALISSTLGWTKEHQPRAIDSLVDWAATPEDDGGLGLERKAAWQFLYATKNAVKHAKDPFGSTKIDPSVAIYMLLAAMINRIRLGKLPDGPSLEATQLLMEIWHQRPAWVEAEARKWEQAGV